MLVIVSPVAGMLFHGRRPTVADQHIDVREIALHVGYEPNERSGIRAVETDFVTDLVGRGLDFTHHHFFGRGENRNLLTNDTLLTETNSGKHRENETDEEQFLHRIVL